ncbi:hypothetical protein LCGC14_1742270 [marine sediment metagenome]|uniref:Uncharacterized protein n=1 Tax=marine sediment metagenome TaxID=412755 RepID=A0A0F9K602_9ZZZZ
MKDQLGRPIIPATSASTDCPLEGKPFECACCKRLTARNAALKEQLDNILAFDDGAALTPENALMQLSLIFGYGRAALDKSDE